MSGENLRVHVARVGNQWAHDYAVNLERRLVRHGNGVVATDVETADVVILATAAFASPDDWTLKELRRSPIFRTHRRKTVVYDERDRPWCWWPGVYVSMPKQSFRPRLQRAGVYLGLEDDRFVPLRSVVPDLLVSFVGNATHPCRRPLFAIDDPQALVRDISSEDFLFWRASSPNFADLRAAFTETMARSKFVLCPRGHGTASIRLFETMAAGRVPVIISDDWEPPAGPDWSSCSLRVPEKDSDQVLSLVRSEEHRFDVMSEASAAAFDGFFAEGRRHAALLRNASGLVSSGATALTRAPVGRHFAELALRNAVRRVRSLVQQKSP